MAAADIRISDVIAHPLRARLPQTQRTSQGDWPSLDIAIVEIRTDAGITGWGECLARTSSPAYAAVVETVLKPRGLVLSDRQAERPVGLACFVLGLFLLLPIPVFSMMPAGAITAIALGILCRDGYAIAVGLMIGLVTIVAFAVLAALGVAAISPG